MATKVEQSLPHAFCFFIWSKIYTIALHSFQQFDVNKVQLSTSIQSTLSNSFLNVLWGCAIWPEQATHNWLLSKMCPHRTPHDPKSLFLPWKLVFYFERNKSLSNAPLFQLFFTYCRCWGLVWTFNKTLNNLQNLDIFRSDRWSVL